MSDGIYTVLSPWAKCKYPVESIFNQRVTDLNGKTVGIWYYFKEHGLYIGNALENILRERFPDVNVTYLQYPVDTKEMKDDDSFIPILQEWLEGVDTVICLYGDGGSCAMFVAYNAAYIESLGKPTMVVTNIPLVNAARRGYTSRGVPDGRIVPVDLQELTFTEKGDFMLNELIRPALCAKADEIILAIVTPMTETESPHPFDEGIVHASEESFTGTYDEVSLFMYKNGWTNGTPVRPPTRERVDDMLTGTDLSPNHIVAVLPPMGGIATVEKIAINAVMAGCLPIHLPAVIACVEAMAHPKLHLEGWTCSVKSWIGPFIVINGPVRNALNMETQSASMGQYTLTQSSIARAFAYIIMNIAGVRPRMEDSTHFGSEGRFGTVLTEDEENSPWEPLQCDYGFSPEDSTINLWWPLHRVCVASINKLNNAKEILEAMCTVEDCSFYPGATFVMTAKDATTLHDFGMSKQQVLDYIVEYSRKPVTQEYLGWMLRNNHPFPGELPMVISKEHTLRKFLDKEHLQIIVLGNKHASGGGAFVGTGDHGGPVCVKINLPKNWNSLVLKYADIRPNYIWY